MRKITVLLLLTSVFTVIAAYTFAQFSPWPMVLVRCFQEDRVVLQTNEALASLVLLGVDFAIDPSLSQFSVVRRVTSDFPSTFISAGNDDALASQSYLLVAEAYLRPSRDSACLRVGAAEVGLTSVDNGGW
jgi:hypothetical protein